MQYQIMELEENKYMAMRAKDLMICFQIGTKKECDNAILLVWYQKRKKQIRVIYIIIISILTPVANKQILIKP